MSDSAIHLPANTSSTSNTNDVETGDFIPSETQDEPTGASKASREEQAGSKPFQEPWKKQQVMKKSSDDSPIEVKAGPSRSWKRNSEKRFKQKALANAAAHLARVRDSAALNPSCLGEGEAIANGSGKEAASGLLNKVASTTNRGNLETTEMDGVVHMAVAADKDDDSSRDSIPSDMPHFVAFATFDFDSPAWQEDTTLNKMPSDIPDFAAFDGYDIPVVETWRTFPEEAQPGAVWSTVPEGGGEGGDTETGTFATLPIAASVEGGVTTDQRIREELRQIEDVFQLWSGLEEAPGAPGGKRPRSKRIMIVGVVLAMAIVVVMVSVILAPCLGPGRCPPPAPTPNVLIANPRLDISPSPTNTPALMIASSPTPAPTDTRATIRPPLPTVQSSNGNHATLVMAYYYTWYMQGNWSLHGYVGTPELGLYGTDNSSVAEKHIEWASGAIDAFVVSWNGMDHYASQHLQKGLLKARNLNQIKFCIFYESLGRLAELNGTVYDRIDFGEPEIMDRFIQDFKHLKETYFSHEQYLKLNDGRPVVSLYVTRIFDNFNRTHIERVENELGMKLFIIADEAFVDASNDPLTSPNGINGDTGESVFEAYTAYNMFEDENVTEGESALSYMQREAWPIFERWAKKTRFFPHIMPSYHDFRGHKPLTGGKEGLLTQLETMECLPKPKGQIPYMMFLTSFNEWWEGTTVEPTKEYGTDYLDTLREYKSNKMPCN